MTPKQQRFVQEYLIDLNATQAAIRAGYKHPDMGRQLLTKTHVQEAIEAAKAERAKRTELTTDYVLNGLRDVAERCRQAEPVLDREGNPTGEYRFDSSGANRALELLGKHLGIFIEKKQVDLAATINVFGAGARAQLLGVAAGGD